MYRLFGVIALVIGLSLIFGSVVCYAEYGLGPAIFWVLVGGAFTWMGIGIITDP